MSQRFQPTGGPAGSPQRPQSPQPGPSRQPAQHFPAQRGFTPPPGMHPQQRQPGGRPGSGFQYMPNASVDTPRNEEHPYACNPDEQFYHEHTKAKVDEYFPQGKQSQPVNKKPGVSGTQVNVNELVEISKEVIDAAQTLITYHKNSIKNKSSVIEKLRSQAQVIDILLFDVLRIYKNTQFYAISDTMTTIRSEIELFEKLVEKAVLHNSTIQSEFDEAISGKLEMIINYKKFEFDVAHLIDSENRKNLKKKLSDIISSFLN